MNSEDNNASHSPPGVTTAGEGNQPQLDPPIPSPTNREGPAKLPAGSHKSESTKKNYEMGVLYINKWLEENDYPKFEELADEDVEADHLENFIDNIMFWLAVTQFKTKSGWLTNKVKVQYFSNIKNAFKHRFPKRDIWAANKEEWWKEQLKDFKDPALEVGGMKLPYFKRI